MTATRPLFGNPSRLSIASVEKLSIGCDVSAYLAGTQTPTAAHLTVSDVATGNAVTLSGGMTPSVAGNVLSALVQPSDLTAGKLYRFTFTMTPSGTSNVFACAVDVNVAY